MLLIGTTLTAIALTVLIVLAVDGLGSHVRAGTCTASSSELPGASASIEYAGSPGRGEG